jgi:hypothetical protein
MSKFTKAEIRTICLFFGVNPSEDVCELPENYFLEESSVEHPVGDILQVQQNGYVVTFEDAVAEFAKHPWYFQRNFVGLVEALKLLTGEVK